MTRFRWPIFLAGIPLILTAAVAGQSAAPDSILVADPVLSDAAAVVTGLPFQSVEEVVLTNTDLDGRRIDIEMSLRRYRDSSGRTRVEEFPAKSDAQNGTIPTGIVIIDPTAGIVHEMRTATHTVYSVSIAKLETDAALPGEPADLTQTLNAPSPAADVVDNYIAMLRGTTMATGKGQEDLGTQTVAGVVAYGQRKTRIAVMAVGSGAGTESVEDVKEDWRSSELQITLLSKRSSSRYGEVDSQVTSIDRREPDPSLFQVPADYTAMHP